MWNLKVTFGFLTVFWKHLPAFFKYLEATTLCHLTVILVTRFKIQVQQSCCRNALPAFTLHRSGPADEFSTTYDACSFTFS